MDVFHILLCYSIYYILIYNSPIYLTLYAYFFVMSLVDLFHSTTDCTYKEMVPFLLKNFFRDVIDLEHYVSVMLKYNDLTFVYIAK